MLVLTRKTQQQIQIGPHITITILQVKGQSVRVGIEAPRDVSVLRTELAARIAAELLPESSGVAGSSDAARSEGSTTIDGRIVFQPSVRCRAPRVDVASQIRHPLRTGPASLGTQGPAPLNKRLQHLLSR